MSCAAIYFLLAALLFVAAVHKMLRLESSLVFGPPPEVAPALSKTTFRRSVRSNLGRRLDHQGRRFDPAGDIWLHPMGNMEYSGTIGLGEQHFQVIFDTGSSNLWVLGQDFAGGTAHGHTMYDSKLSANNGSDGRQFHCHYQSGDAWGTFAHDVLELRGVSANISFGVVRETNIQIPNNSFDGIFGLGWASNSVDKSQSAVEALYQVGQIQEPVFAFFFPQLDDGVGEFIVGGLDAAKYEGQMTWIPVLQQSNSTQWAIMLKDAKFGQKLLGASNQFAIIDSGMSHIGIPFELYDGLMEDLKFYFHRVGWNHTAGTDQLPHLVLSMGSANFALTSADYLFLDESNVAHPMLAKLPKAPPWQTFWLLGDVFFRRHYVAFDYRNDGRIGIAQARTVASP